MKGKKAFSAGLTAVLMCSMMAGSTNMTYAASTEKEQTGDRETMNFWYLWGGDEASYIEQIIDAYNASQDKYQVVGLSTPDQQKVITGISGGNGPDITDDFGTSIPNYAEQNIAMPLDDYIEKDGINPEDVFVDGTMDEQVYQDKTYAFPISANVDALYYNKDLLKAGGYDAPPKTMEELQEMSSKLTTVEDGEVTQLGAPLVPNSYWWECMTFADGSTFGTPGDLEIDNEGFRKALSWLESYVKEFGSDAVNSFVTSGQAKVNSAQDPFLSGKEALRIDGPWFYKMAEDSGVNFGLAMLPSYESEGDKTYNYIATSNFYIPTTASNPDGAWDFLKYITMGDGAKMFVTLKGDLPALKSLLKDQDVIKASASYDVYLKALSESSLVAMPNILDGSDLDVTLTNAVDSVVLGGSADDAIQEAADTASGLE